jgi:AcrR family transcriptional regulator
MTECLSSEETTTRWERRKEQTHQRLLGAGERLFRTQGFDATTVEEIAAAADVAKGTFFNYFASKETLLGDLLDMRTQPLLDAPPAEKQPTPERIWQLLQAVRQELSPYIHLFPRMFSYALAHPKPDASVRRRSTLAQAVAHLVRDGQGRGCVQPGLDPEAAGAMISTYFFRLSMLESVCETDAEFHWEEQMQAGLDVIYQGLMVANGHPSPDVEPPLSAEGAA